MISDETLDRLADYWRRHDVPMDRATLTDSLSGTDLAQVWERVGMPKQTWWLFRFEQPSNVTLGTDVLFGNAGEWKLYFRPGDGSCVAKDGEGTEYFMNSSVGAFMQALTLWDTGYRRNEAESPGDSGEDWDHGDLIFREVQESMRAMDPAAFESESFVWPILFEDMG